MCMCNEKNGLERFASLKLAEWKWIMDQPKWKDLQTKWRWRRTKREKKKKYHNSKIFTWSMHKQTCYQKSSSSFHGNRIQRKYFRLNRFIQHNYRTKVRWRETHTLLETFVVKLVLLFRFIATNFLITIILVRERNKIRTQKTYGLRVRKTKVYCLTKKFIVRNCLEIAQRVIDCCRDLFYFRARSSTSISNVYDQMDNHTNFLLHWREKGT